MLCVALLHCDCDLHVKIGNLSLKIVVCPGRFWAVMDTTSVGTGNNGNGCRQPAHCLQVLPQQLLLMANDRYMTSGTLQHCVPPWYQFLNYNLFLRTLIQDAAVTEEGSPTLPYNTVLTCDM